MWACGLLRVCMPSRSESEREKRSSLSPHLPHPRHGSGSLLHGQQAWGSLNRAETTPSRTPCKPPRVQAPTRDGCGPGCTFAPLSSAPRPRDNVEVRWPEPPELRILPQHLPQKVPAGRAAHTRPGKRAPQGGAQKDGMPARGWMGSGEPAPPFCTSRPRVALGDVGLSLQVAASPPGPRGGQAVPVLPEPCSGDGARGRPARLALGRARLWTQSRLQPGPDRQSSRAGGGRACPPTRPGSPPPPHPLLAAVPSLCFPGL